jgi:hypothetical protein
MLKYMYEVSVRYKARDGTERGREREKRQPKTSPEPYGTMACTGTMVERSSVEYKWYAAMTTSRTTASVRAVVGLALSVHGERAVGG